MPIDGRTSSPTGIVLVLTFIVFLVMKLAKIGAVASWSWWWVTAPLWAPMCLAMVICLIIFIKLFPLIK
ncbi:hypothetical protein AXF24_12505 [Streptococcus pneumoniae]|nr:hypothetical protein AWW74_12520 [Streptococcus pneumoniae]KXB94838.1 hypothetical protein AXF24_12505 [Streptococcus pneumoniae]